MLLQVTLLNLYDSSTVSLYTGTSYELNHFEWAYPTAGDDVKKGQSTGRFKNFKLVEFMSIDLKGAILCDTVDAYWTARKALLAAAIPNPASDQRDHVRITTTLDDGGGGTAIYADCVLDTVVAPLEALYPTTTQFEFGYDCRDGFWRKVSDGSYIAV